MIEVLFFASVLVVLRLAAASIHFYGVYRFRRDIDNIKKQYGSGDEYET